MRIIITSSVLLLASALCFSQDGASENSLGYDLDAYTTTWGGWYINRQCSYLDSELKGEFEANLEVIDEAMLREIPNQNMLAALKSSVESTVENPPYSDCQEKSVGIIERTSAHAQSWAIQIQSESR